VLIVDSVTLVLALTLSSGAAMGHPQQIVVRDVEGHRLNLFGPEVKASVFFFITTDCPISNSYAPEIDRIAANYSAAEIKFYAVYVDRTISIPVIQRHAVEFGLKLPLIRDNAHSLVRRVGATVTPEAAVIGRGGKLIYLGPIDDLYVDFGKRRPSPTQSFLRQVLDGVLSGKPVVIPAVNPVGCSISLEP